MRCKPEKLMYALTMNSAQTRTDKHGTPETAPASGSLPAAPKGVWYWLLYTSPGSSIAAVILAAILGSFGWLVVSLIADTNQDINSVKTELKDDITRVEEHITRVEAKIDNLIVSLVASRTPLPASDIVSKASFSGELSHIRP